MTPHQLAAIIRSAHAIGERKENQVGIENYPREWQDMIVAALEAFGAAQASTWRPIETAPKDGTIVLAWWLNGEQHTGSTDGVKWFPAWEHQDTNWMLPQLWKPLVDPDEATERTAVALAVSSTQEKPLSFCSRCGGNDPDCYICGTVGALTDHHPTLRHHANETLEEQEFLFKQSSVFSANQGGGK
jgi:hypothetical protein